MRTDLSALKFNQLSVVALTALALLVRQPWLSGLLGAAMLIGAVWPQRSPMKAAYRTLAPLLGLRPDVVDESPEAHHFAQGVGGVFLLASALAVFGGLTGLGIVLGFLVIGLALLNLTARICVGCLMYFQYRMLRYRLTARS
ncbi:DUF4395 domain-containing protein [Deinococcus rubellus]|uniref:DUF4395 domain-containing protein n=1 Tax=Deinococcus rubellus TaxID=1889240 RepID=A0ABY5YFK0_9DEIO|nr:DUF4395 domain-containing protein [Deinococcus rubellus]UWX63855.1 DUF4395 domain-containing protein [Deinococcus rubellus]